MNEKKRNVKNEKPGYSFLIPVRQAQHALIAIWFMGVISVSVAAVYIFQPAGEVSRKLNQFNIVQENRSRVQSIDELLISPGETAMVDKKAFVNGALRFQWRNPDPYLSDDNNRNFLYNNILKKKLQRLPQAGTPDFSIRPVPQ